ncbi:MAG: S1 RNA-binding domain-containing protein [Lachnospiraceae bacterium]|nr:S1 RNA-binding domain-containing protein [Sarcina sp.]MBQ6590233.1 S1 RNA-binding domain-containing protein [Lachnospiraceae bacterium]
METMNDFKEELEASFRELHVGDIVDGTVIGISDDGVTVDLKYYTQGFIRNQDMSNDPTFNVVQDVHEGDAIKAAILKMDNGDGSIALSRKAAIDVLAWEKLQEMMDNKEVITVQILETVKAGVVTYVEGIRAFIPASQLSDAYVENTADWIDKDVDVRIITCDPEKKRLVLSGREVARDRRREERRRRIDAMQVGTVLEGTVETIKPYGAFVDLGDGISGLVHISQMSQKRVNNPAEVVKEGEKVKVRITKVADGKISLSMKALEDAPVQDKEEAVDISKYTTKENATTSLGDLLKGFKFD